MVMFVTPKCRFTFTAELLWTAIGVYKRN